MLFHQKVGFEDALVQIGSAKEGRLPFIFDLLMWNIYKAKKMGWAGDFHGLLHGVELVMLQESVISEDIIEVFEKEDGFEWYMAKSYATKTKGIVTGVKTGAVVKALQNLYYRSPDREPFVHTPKMILASEYGLDGGEDNLLVVNVHAINFVTSKKFKRQMAQAAGVIKGHKGPVILAGDFNSWNRVRRDFLSNLIVELKLKEADIENRPRALHIHSRYDHVFYRGLKVVSALCHNHIKSSDHAPIKIRFERG